MTKMIEVSKIENGTNVRNEKDVTLYELAESINENGLLQPITVRKIKNGKYEVINGHRRLEAVKYLQESFIECNVLDVNDKERLILQVVENVQRQNMSAYELVEVFNGMKEAYKCNNKAIAHYFGKSEQWVYDNYCAVKLLEKEFAGGSIPEDKKKLSAGMIKVSVTKKRKGNAKSCECEGFSVRKHGHSYIINCSQFDAETELNEFIQARMKTGWVEK